MVYSPVHDKFYTVDQSGHLIEIDHHALTIGRIANFVAEIGQGPFGAVWSDSNGDLMISQNESGNIYFINMNEAGVAEGIQFLMQGESTQANDGASCVLAASPFVDSDGDGVINEYDAYPNDPTRIYTDYSPAQSTVGSYAFEDKWPKQGDYDFNDLVIDYSYEFAKNAQNQIGSMRATFTTRVVGATFQLGFGFQLDDLEVNDILSVSGTDAPSITTRVNGLETNQSKPVIIVMDDVHTQMGSTPGNFINTGGGVDRDLYTLSVVVNFANPQDDVGKINPFIITQGDRQVEVHLKGFSPTDKAGGSLFGTEDDASSGTDTYQTASGLPWALDFPEQFTPPVERTVLNDAYPDFSEWVGNNGATKTDWYKKVKAIQGKLNSKTFPEEGDN